MDIFYQQLLEKKTEKNIAEITQITEKIIPAIISCAKFIQDVEGKNFHHLAFNILYTLHNA